MRRTHDTSILAGKSAVEASSSASPPKPSRSITKISIGESQHPDPPPPAPVDDKVETSADEVDDRAPAVIKEEKIKSHTLSHPPKRQEEASSER